MWNSGECLEAYADAVVRNNVVFACRTGLFSMRYQGTGANAAGKPPENLFIHNNTFHGEGGLVIRDWDSARACVFANNAVYSTAAGEAWEIEGTGSLYGNVGDQAHAGFSPGDASADLLDPAGRMFQPRAGSALIDRSTGSLSAGGDFEGADRDAKPDVGAYEFRGAGPGRALAEGFKGR